MKNSSYLTGKTILLLALMLVSSSCEKNYLDVNTSPNNTVNAGVKQILPAAIAHTAYVMGNEYQIIGGYWGQYWTQGPTGNQYNVYDQYLITNTTFDRPWSDMYDSPLADFKKIIELSKNNNTRYAGIACIMQAYIFQVLTDLHGDVPFSEALKGDEGLYSPHFDSQLSIYDGLISLVDEGIAYIENYTGDDINPQEDDFIYGGDGEKWVRFANTLKLKIYMRQSEVRPSVAQAGIALLESSGATFLGDGDDAEMPFNGAIGNQNPLYAQIASLGSFNILASNTALLNLKNNNDPRIDVFYRTATSGDSVGLHNGINQGEGKTPGFGGPDVVSGWYSKPSFVIAGPDSPVILMSTAESNFLQSEAMTRGWLAGNDQSLYEAGITASFERWGFDASDATAYYQQGSIAFPSAGSPADKIKATVTQKWIAMNGTECAEAWTEWRRTGYPDFFTLSVTSQIGNVFPQTLLYPNSEQTLNTNTPPQHNITDKVWWDVN